MPAKLIKRIRKTRFNLRQKRILALSAAVVIVILPVTLNQYKSTINPDQTPEASFLADGWLSNCTGESCIRKGLETITKMHGPAKAIESYEHYHKQPGHIKGDDHLRVHYVGRQAATTFGLSGDTFLKCPPIFNYGCMHGFFEKALGQELSAQKASETICGPIEASPSYSSNNKYYCYHGLGHGVMMAQAYDLQGALRSCDKFKSQLAQTGCWQGVFMENVNGQMNGGAREGVFSKDDPMAPCNKVEEKYKRECYLNHHGYLFQLYNWKLEPSAHACLQAAAYIVDCLEGMGLAATSNVWQPILLGQEYTADPISDGWKICKMFPEGHATPCVTGGVTTILQIDRFDLRQAVSFCGIVHDLYKKDCYQRIGHYMRLESPDAKKAASYCNQLPTKWQNVCRQAAGIGTG